MIKTPLTAAQYALAERHLHLIYFTFKLMKWSTKKNNYDTIYDVALDNLFKAAKAYDESRGDFRNIAITAIKNGLTTWWNSKKQHHLRKQLNFSSQLTNGLGNKEKSLNFDAIFSANRSYNGKNEDDIHIVNKMLSYLSEPQRRTLMGIYGLNGCKKVKQATLAKELGVNTCMVSYYLLSGLKELKHLAKKLNRHEMLN